jgi:hypothetical protein
MKTLKRFIIERFQRILFKILFKKIPKKQFGRCVSCEANQICHKPQYGCECTMEEQYILRDFREIL